MALNADLQILTQPGSTGNQTYSLASNFDPKAVILWAVPLAADGTAANYAIGVGFGTYRGSAVVQRYGTMRGLDAAASADIGFGQNTNALLVLLTNSAAASSRDLEITLVSMATGASSNVVLNWVNLHTTASIKVFMLALGGSDITDALAGNFATGTASTTQDVTVTAGFGKPELVFMFGSTDNLFTGDFAASIESFCFGFGRQGEAGRVVDFSQQDGNTASLVGMRQRSDRIASAEQWGGDLMLGRLDTTVANWPTDGFRMLYDANPVLSAGLGYLALRGTFQSASGSNTAVIAGSPPVDQDNACGFAPKLGLVFGWNLAASTAINSTAADLGGFGIGAYDGTDQAWAGITEDDAAATMVSKSQQETDHILANYSVAAVLQSSATAAFSGNNFRLSWDDIDSVAREYQWLALGDAAAAGAASDLALSPLRPYFHLLPR